ncbi:hypothetical protein [Labedaea rhizosphaerae]|uniref:Lipoprotein n=1 Tax=Labedaea rhizosphaerae TaxID=598644 RepID=A0A4R6SFW3_LABRH|nr:hypothetical protein [Labedaea rhizosphaerae]TDQ00400.1 hypothetical protein EV186_102261 [Labedaea rhizosphaerae]
MLRSIPLLLVALLLAGCGAAVPAGSPRPVETFPPTEQVKALHLPLDAYSFSDAELYTISNAEDVLIAECLRGKGYTWPVINRPTDAPDLRNRRRYGVIEMRIAQFGYHVPAGLLTPISLEQAYDKRDRTLGEGAKEAAFGKDGCGRKAADRLQAGDDSNQALLVRSSHDSLYDSLSDPAVARALNSWRDCMRQATLTYPDPLAAMSDQKWWADQAAGPSKQEILVASTDVTCKNRTNLVEVWYTAETRFQNKVLNQHPGYFKDRRAAMKKELDAAQAVLTRS